MHPIEHELPFRAQSCGRHVAPRDDILGEATAFGPLAAAGDDEIAGCIADRHGVAECVETRFGWWGDLRRDVGTRYRVQGVAEQRPVLQHRHVALVERLESRCAERLRRAQLGRAQRGSRPANALQMPFDGGEALRDRHRLLKAQTLDCKAVQRLDALRIRKAASQKGEAAVAESDQFGHIVSLRVSRTLLYQPFLDPSRERAEGRTIFVRVR